MIELNLHPQLLNILNRVAKSYNMSIEELIVQHLEDYYG
jgi:hypothetical protein